MDRNSLKKNMLLKRKNGEVQIKGQGDSEIKGNSIGDTEQIFRVLAIADEEILVIDCIKKTMPAWMEIEKLDDFTEEKETRYFFRKYNTKQTEYISRNGLSYYQRNQRPLTGDGVQAFAPHVGVGMLDATILDIYLINEAGGIVGRSILTACVDAYSGLCCGYLLSWEGGVYSLRNLMLNVIADKVEHCRAFGIAINRQDWDCDKLSGKVVTDMGSEYRGTVFEQMTDLGIQITNLPSYRPELKSKVEKFFDCIQGYYRNQLKGKGVVEPDFQERGVHDYRKDACLTMADFEKIIIHCILFYNCSRVLENFPYTEEMLAMEIKPYANEIWNYGCGQDGWMQSHQCQQETAYPDPAPEGNRQIHKIRAVGQWDALPQQAVQGAVPEWERMYCRL